MVIMATYIKSIFLIAYSNLDTDMILTYLAGKTLNTETAGYVYSAEYLQAHKHLNPIIPVLSPPFVVMIAACIARYVTYSGFFITLMSLSVVFYIITLIKVYYHFFAKTQHCSGVVLAAFILANFCYLPTLINITFGQVGILLSAITILSYLALENKQPIRAGGLIALAMNIKLFFGLFLIYFLAKKNYRALAAFLAFDFFFATLPLFFYGLYPYQGYWAALSDVHWYALNWNASWYGMCTRLFGEPTHLFASLLFSPRLGACMYYFIFCIYISIIYYLGRKKTNNHSLLFAFTLSSMLLLSPLGWNYYFPILITALLINLNKAKFFKEYILFFCLLLSSIFFSAMPLALYNNTKIEIAHIICQGNIFFVALLTLNITNLWQLWLEPMRQEQNVIPKHIQCFIFFICLLPSIVGMSAIAFARLINH